MSLKDEIKNFFQSNPKVIALYLFGSEAKEKANAQSDVDIAVLYERNSIPTSLEILDIRSELESKLRRDVDLVIFNNANPILKHQIFKKGTLLLVNNRKLHNDFFVKSVMEYDDIQRVRAKITPFLLKGRIYGR